MIEMRGGSSGGWCSKMIRVYIMMCKICSNRV